MAECSSNGGEVYPGQGIGADGWVSIGFIGTSDRSLLVGDGMTRQGKGGGT